MGGKNPAIVAASADLDEAAEGVMRSAFGYDGQKCSACSRVYVDNRVKDKFVALLLDYTGKRVKVGDPSKRETFMGPVINRAAVETFQGAVNAAMHAGGKILYGGHVLTEGEYAEGYFVEPTIVDGLPKNHPAFKEEYFVPFLAIAGVDSLDEALKEANDCEYGLCAGIFSEDAAEVQKFFDHIEAGVLYANRRAGATTGAWPGVNSFGGWKGSGCTGKSGLGPYYVQQFMREQSRWVVK
jgi:1-pyrroline-5-carboxylate dehydrogenase